MPDSEDFLNAARKIVVAHRGASAYLPEHSLAAYALAHAQGADAIEPDVVLTKDGVPICRHDLFLETTTDAAELFPERAREDGHIHAIDLTLAEIRTLRLRGPHSEHRVATLDELILLVQTRNAATGRRVGLLIETKDPAFHSRENQPIEAPLLESLARHGLTARDSGVVVQSFDGAHLRRLRTQHGSQLPLMWLTSSLPTLAVIDEVATFADGVNPNRAALAPDGNLTDDARSALARIRAAGLRVFVWTFRDDTDAMRRFLHEFGVDGVITNNPDFGVRAAREL